SVWRCSVESAKSSIARQISAKLVTVRQNFLLSPRLQREQSEKAERRKNLSATRAEAGRKGAEKTNLLRQTAASSGNASAKSGKTGEKRGEEKRGEERIDTNMGVRIPDRRLSPWPELTHIRLFDTELDSIRKRYLEEGFGDEEVRRGAEHL